MPKNRFKTLKTIREPFSSLMNFFFQFDSIAEYQLKDFKLKSLERIYFWLSQISLEM